jgi:tellurite resistance protein
MLFHWIGSRLERATVARSFVSAITLSVFGHPDCGMPLLGVGVLSWLAIESVLVHRLHAVELPPPLRPTLSIQLAPPTVGCAAYLSITTGPPDVLAQMLLGYGVFQALLMRRLLPWIARQPFAPSYWGVTFGLSAIATSFLRFSERTAAGPMAVAAHCVFIAVNLAIGGIAAGTLWLVPRGRLLPPPLVPPPAPLQRAPRVL